jgi:hypothetical protein
LQIGKIVIGTVDDWSPAPGVLISWHPTAAAMEKARQAPVSSVPVSFMQGQHLRGVYHQGAAGLDYSRQIIATCEVPGQCDIQAMTHALNSYLRRHDTYRSWFEYDGDGEIVRRSLPDSADIEFEPVDQGVMSTEDARKHIVDIPSPFEWGCFSFGIVQSEDHFDFYASIDHVHGDAALIGITMLEAHGMYTAMSATGQPMSLPHAGSFDDFCVQEREATANLTVDSPEVRDWIEFAENNNNTLPEFPLPLGDPNQPTVAEMVGEMIMDADQTKRFEAACATAGVRFVGGLFACTAKVEHELPAERRTISRPRGGSPDWFRSPSRSRRHHSAKPPGQHRSRSIPARSLRGSRTTGCSNWRPGWTTLARTFRCITSCTGAPHR